MTVNAKSPGRGNIANVPDDLKTGYQARTGMDLDVTTLRLIPYAIVSAMDRHIRLTLVSPDEIAVLDAWDSLGLFWLHPSTGRFIARDKEFWDLLTSIVFEAYATDTDGILDIPRTAEDQGGREEQ